MAAAPLPGKARAREHRVWAHRWGPACAISATEQAVLGIRYDEEDDSAAETFLVRLGPGRAEALDQLAGVARAVAAAESGTPFVLDSRGVVHAGGRRHRLASPRAMVGAWGGVVLAADDRLWLFSPDGAQVTPGPLIHARQLAASKHGLLVATDDARLVLLESPGAVPRDVPLDAAGHMAALAVDDDGKVAASSGRTVLAGNLAGIAPVASAPFEIHAVAVHRGVTLLSSRAHGLFCLDEKTVMPKKPSLRAHTLAVKDGILLAASDLFVATSDDGIDFLTRDLAPFVRLADSRLPRFLQPEDPASV